MEYVRSTRVYLGGDYVEFSGSSVVKGATGWLAVGAGQYVDLPAEVVVSPDLLPQYYGREVRGTGSTLSLPLVSQNTTRRL